MIKAFQALVLSEKIPTAYALGLGMLLLAACWFITVDCLRRKQSRWTWGGFFLLGICISIYLSLEISDLVGLINIIK